MFLITTADQQFWRNDKPVLFLGEWCKLYSQKHVWQAMQAETLIYHWDDRSRLAADQVYLADVYEHYLRTLATRLNQIHSVQQSERFWRIVVGPWLHYFVEILYDRYLSILEAAKHGGISDTLISEADALVPPLNFTQFDQWFCGDSYNHDLYSWLIRKTELLPFTEISRRKPRAISRQKESLGKKIINLIPRMERWIPPSLNRVVLVATQLRPLELLRLQTALSQFPYPVAPEIKTDPAGVQHAVRTELAMAIGRNPFERLVDSILHRQIPIAYVESFQGLRRSALRAFPRNPKMILTANAEVYDDGFKVWAATYADKDVPILISQHGGTYGTAFWYPNEDHARRISDRYYTWGWSQKAEGRTMPMPSLKLSGQRKIRPSDSGRILWALTGSPRFSYQLPSIPIAGQFMHYLEDQFRLAAALSPDIRRRIVLRLYPYDFGWNVEARWRERFPDVQIYRGNASMESQLQETSIFIGTSNSTTFLQTMAANYPTILFWNPDQWELRSDAEPYFRELSQSGILHASSESAATRIQEVSKDPFKWWYSDEIQRVRERFCSRFALTSPSWVNEWKAELQSIRDGKNSDRV